MKRIKAVAALIAVTVILILVAMTAQAVDIQPPPEVIEMSELLGMQYGICPELIQAICFRESSFRADAENGGCIGIMQVSDKWHRDRMERLGVADLHDMYGCMLVAVDYLAELFEQYCDVAEVLSIYHGERNVRERMGRGEVSQYVKDILNLSEQLEREHGK